MIWETKPPASGDMVRVKLGHIYHYGVFVSDTEIIQFGLAPSARTHVKNSDIEVCASDITAFSCGGEVEVGVFDEQEKRNTAEQTVALARARLGEKGYHILYNNCEHFAYECVTGEKKCTQADAVRMLFRSMPVVDVYWAELPEKIPENGLETLFPASRADEIIACSNELVKRQKYYVWRLLEYAFMRTFGYKISTLELHKNEHGKWETPQCFFSLSHSGNALAVAVSRTPVGVDIEKINGQKTQFLEKILTEKEREQLCLEENKTAFLVRRWSEKESIFKTLNEARFAPAKIQTGEHSVSSSTVEIAGEEYVLSVATEYLDKVRCIQKTDLIEG